MNRRALIAVLAIGALAAASGWLSRESRRPDTPAADIPAAPDYFTRDFVAVTTGPDGLPQRELRAEQMLHLPENNTLELTAPHLVLFEGATPRWQVSANRGRVERDGDTVLLEGEVLLQEGAPRQLNLATDTLHIYPDRQYAETAAPVTLTAPEGRVAAVGMEADMNRRQINLLSKVQGVYEPVAP